MPSSDARPAGDGDETPKTMIPEPMTLERTRATLEGLTRAQIVAIVTERIVPEDLASFAILSEGLSLEALRFLSARALVRMAAVSKNLHREAGSREG